jgi:hypothetical protein
MGDAQPGSTNHHATEYGSGRAGSCGSDAFDRLLYECLDTALDEYLRAAQQARPLGET